MGSVSPPSAKLRIAQSRLTSHAGTGWFAAKRVVTAGGNFAVTVPLHSGDNDFKLTATKSGYKRKTLLVAIENKGGPSTGTETAIGGGGGAITMPDLSGMDHQAAQDTLQAKGLYNLREKDASGQGRLLLWDRNWVVRRTDPPAGTKVSLETKITLYSLKDDEVPGE